MLLSFSLRLPRDEVSVPLVRHLCRDAMLELGVTDEIVADIELATTEAASNVLRHAHGTRRDYEVVVEINEDNCEIKIIDAGPGMAPDKMETDSVPVQNETGRGVFLMKALVDDLKFVSKPDVGTIVHLVKKLECDDSALLRRLAAAKS